MHNSVFGGDYWYLGYCCWFYTLWLLASVRFVHRRLPSSDSSSRRSSPSLLAKLKLPELHLLSPTFFFVLMILIIELGNPRGVPQTSITVADHEIPLWFLGLFTLLTSGAVLSFIITVQAHTRKSHGLRDISIGPVDTVNASLACGTSLVWGLGIGIYFVGDNVDGLILCIFLPLVWVTFVKFWERWAANDYSILTVQ